MQGQNYKKISNDKEQRSKFSHLPWGRRCDKHPRLNGVETNKFQLHRSEIRK